MANGNGDPEIPDRLQILSKLGKTLTDLSEISREVRDREQFEHQAAAQDAARAPGGGQGGGLDFAQELMRTAAERNQQMRDFGGRDVRAGPGILSFLLPTPAGAAGGGAGVARGFTRTPRGPTPADLQEAGQFGMIDEIMKLSNAEKTRGRFEALSRLFGGGPSGTGVSTEATVLGDQVLPLIMESALRARRGDILGGIIDQVRGLP